MTKNKNRSVWILGFGEFDFADAPWHDPDADIWLLNTMHVVLKDGMVPDAWFQIHLRENLWKESAGHIDWLKEEHPFPIYMVEKFPEFPASVKYPRAKVAEFWNGSRPPSWSCSFAYMIGLAILKGYGTIYLRNIDLITPREAWLEAPGVAAWAGIAMGRGIKVDDGTDRLLYPFNYGYEPRPIPTWAPVDVARDVITDSMPLLKEWIRNWEDDRALCPTRTGTMETPPPRSLAFIYDMLRGVYDGRPEDPMAAKDEAGQGYGGTDSGSPGRVAGS